MGKLSHELKHADQYMDRKLGFDLRGVGKFGKLLAYDRFDEYEAYERQGLFGNTLSEKQIDEQYKHLLYSKRTIENIQIPYNYEQTKSLNQYHYNPKIDRSWFLYSGWKKDLK